MRTVAYIHIPYLHAMAHIKAHGGSGGNKVGVLKANTVIGTSQGIEHVVGMTKRHARQACPDICFVAYDPDIYPPYANAVWDICAEHTPLVEPVSDDGCFLDLTGCGDRVKIMEDIAIKAREFGIEFGMAPSKLVAKIAWKSGIRHYIAPESVEGFLSPMPVSALWPIDYWDICRLEQLGIKTVAMVREISVNDLISQLGESGLEVHLFSRGIDRSRVKPAYPPESISHTISLDSPITDLGDLEQCIGICAEAIASELEKTGRACGAVVVRVSMDQGDYVKKHDFKTAESSGQAIARAIMRAVSSKIGSPVNEICVEARALTSTRAVQMSMFSHDPIGPGIDKAMIRIRERFGARSITKGKVLVRSRRERMLMEANVYDQIYI